MHPRRSEGLDRSGGEALAAGRGGAEREDELVRELRAEGRYEPLMGGRSVRIEASAVSGQKREAPPAWRRRYGVHPVFIIDAGAADA